MLSRYVKDYMTKNAEYIMPDTTLKDAANKMVELNTGSLPVGNGDKLLGFITDRDITVKAVAQGLDPEQTTVDKIMTKEVLYCYENTELESALSNMKENEVLRLIVLNNDKKFVGVITHGQLSKAAIDKNDMDLCKKTTELACYDKVA